MEIASYLEMLSQRLLRYNIKALNIKHSHLGVAQLVARYLGVVEAASSSLVTQTKIGGSTEPPIFFILRAFSGF